MSQTQSTQSPSQPRKRKHSLQNGPKEPDTKKSKHSDKQRKKKDKSSGNHKHHLSRRSKDDAETGEFKVVSSTLVVAIPPMYASNPRRGVQEMLDGMLMRYIPALEGVVISHSNLQFLDRKATIKADCPFAMCRVAFDATVWSPQVGMKLLGKVNLCSPDHISLLVHKVFNASIPRHHIPTDHWEFEYGPAENDPEFAPDVVVSTAQDGEDVPMGDDSNPNPVEKSINSGEGEGETTSNDGGRWVHHITSEKIGGAEGYLEFTVIGLTIANQMLSLVGSIQADPFSPHHIPIPSSKQSQAEDQVVMLGERTTQSHPPDSDNDLDAFAQLGKMADEAKEAELRAREQAEIAAQQVKQKKKRKTFEQANGDEQKKAKKSKRTKS